MCYKYINYLKKFPIVNFMVIQELVNDGLCSVTSSVNSIKSVFSTLLTIRLGIMENRSSRLDLLVRRLDEAERRAKLLKLEVKSIRQEITTLRHTVNNSSNREVIFVDAVLPVSRIEEQTRTVLLDSVPGTSTVDGPDSPPQNKRLKVSFPMDNEYVRVYTDGACENNGKPNAKAGIGVWFDDGHPLNISKPLQGRATNNHAEIRACIEALNTIQENGGNKTKIYTDSEFTINCMTKWLRNWKKNNWKTAKGEPVKNKEELQELDRIINSFEDVKWVHVAGHRGIKGNEKADKLAREGAARYKPN